MLSRSRQAPGVGQHVADQGFDTLIARIRRLTAHRGYEREALMSPMLKRLIPSKMPSGDPIAETAELRKRLTEARFDGNSITYLAESVETELELARLRLT